MTDGKDGEGVPLDIAGHEDRADPREDAGEPFGDERDAGEGAEEADGNDPGPEQNGEDGDDPGPEQDAIPEDLTPDVDHPEEDEEAVRPVELLVQLAKDGEIDPWDIDLMEVTDKFLAKLEASDLRTSARALFYASVLLRMKGDDLLEQGEPDEPEPEPWEQPPGEEDLDGDDPVESLEAEMERRIERKRVRGKPETLEELVHELREAEQNKWWKEARTYDTSGSPSGYGRGTQQLDYHADDASRMGGEPTQAEVTERTHGEDIETVIDDVRTALREQYEQGREEVLYAEIEETGPSRVMTYLALLFLAHRGEVALAQDELFGDLWVRDTGAVTGTGEVAAD
jgi:segregation and condensation protein A